MIAILAFFGFFNVYSLRVNLSIAIVAMTANQTVAHLNGELEQVKHLIGVKKLYSYMPYISGPRVSMEF